MENRVYEASTGRFGSVVRSSGILGLKDCRAVLFDDGTKGAFFGPRVSEVECVTNDCPDMPTDLVGIWNTQLTADHSSRLVKAYIALDADGQQAARKRWASTTDVAKFEI